jgi:cephalosporin hydroxylase
MNAENSAPGLDYFRWFYEQGVWKRMHYRGVRILKFPCDLWNYQEIFAERGIQWVLEPERDTADRRFSSPTCSR